MGMWRLRKSIEKGHIDGFYLTMSLILQVPTQLYKTIFNFQTSSSSRHSRSGKKRKILNLRIKQVQYMDLLGIQRVQGAMKAADIKYNKKMHKHKHKKRNKYTKGATNNNFSISRSGQVS